MHYDISSPFSAILAWLLLISIFPLAIAASTNSPFTDPLNTTNLYHVRFTFGTTSDWSEFQINTDVPFLVTCAGVTQGADTPGLTVSPKGIHKRQYDPTPITAAYDFWFNASPNLFLPQITKGGMGVTTFTLATREPQSIGFPAPGRQRHINPPNWMEAERYTTITTTTTFSRRTLAFYYPWYDAPTLPGHTPRHWPEGHTHSPQLGEYSSHDPSIVRQHITMLGDAGIQTLVTSWWGPHSYEDDALRKTILPELAPTTLTTCVYLEAAATSQTLLSSLIYIDSTLAASPHYLRVANKPVVFIYGRVFSDLPPRDIRAAITAAHRAGHDLFIIADSFDPTWLDVCDGLHTYNPVGRALSNPTAFAQLYQAMTLTCASRNKLFVATLLPGYDDSHLTPPRPNPTILDRHNGDLYQSICNQTLASGAPWAIICTFNEWHEGSEIEPSLENKSRELQTTKAFTKKFLPPHP